MRHERKSSIYSSTHRSDLLLSLSVFARHDILFASSIISHDPFSLKRHSPLARPSSHACIQYDSTGIIHQPVFMPSPSFRFRFLRFQHRSPLTSLHFTLSLPTRTLPPRHTFLLQPRTLTGDTHLYNSFVAPHRVAAVVCDYSPRLPILLSCSTVYCAYLVHSRPDECHDAFFASVLCRVLCGMRV